MNENSKLSITKNTIYHLAFIVGYSQRIPSRSFRRLLAGTKIHRAWLAGNQGCIGEPEGVLYRLWHTNRKHHKSASIKQMLFEISQYYNLKPGQSLIRYIAQDIRENINQNKS